MTKHAREQETARRSAITARLLGLSRQDAAEILRNSSLPGGLTEELVEARREEFGPNKIVRQKHASILRRIIDAFFNPFTCILLLLAAVSFFTDVWYASSGNKNPMTVIIVLAMVLISGFLRFIQETRSGNAAARLSEMVKTTASVERKPEGRQELPLEDIVVGDLIYLSAGDMIPADVRIVRAKDLFISQAALTGESEPQEKNAAPATADILQECHNMAFMGSNVISGSATAVVVAVGNETLFGGIAKALTERRETSSFEKGVNSVSWTLIRFMLIMVPIVFVVNGVTKHDWTSAFLFAISIAVGLTPEMLPMIVTTCLAKGAVAMSRKKTIIKHLNAMQNFGAMDVLCTDKTGTLTQDRVVLEVHMDIRGNIDPNVLYHGFLNSYYQTGLKNLVDIAIINKAKEEIGGSEKLDTFTRLYEKVDEIPFDFSRRRMSVVVVDKKGRTQMITKGAVEEMLSVCSRVEYKGQILPLTEEIRQDVFVTMNRLNADGMRVIAVAHKLDHAPVGAFSVADEADMILIGYLAFLDPPKITTEAAIRALREHGVSTKVLTGDNDRVTQCVCRQVGLHVDNLLLGSDIEAMTDDDLAVAVEHTNVFAKLSPQQKARIVRILRHNGHTVGYMGDGINDAAAMKVADVGISVDTAVDIAKESADIILLEKDLMVLENGIIEGRKTYANMIKYIKMTASSNFGNVFSVLLASAFLPFLPMLSVQLLLLNLIYDVSCTAIPWDNVDAEYLKKPRTWDAKSVGAFMVYLGPTSSLFDITTYLLMYFVICPAMLGGYYHQLTTPGAQATFAAIFQAGWFVESMWSQTLVIHMIRTPKIPFIQSRASFHVVAITFAGIAALTAIPFTPLGAAIGLGHLPPVYFAWLLLTICLYMVLAQIMKRVYIARYGELH